MTKRNKRKSGEGRKSRSSSVGSREKRLSVFDRLGTKALPAEPLFCRHNLQYAACTHCLSKLTSQSLPGTVKRTVKKTSDLRPSEDGSGAGASGRKEFGGGEGEWWDAALEYEDERELERRKHLLQRELERQMRDDISKHNNNNKKRSSSSSSSSSSASSGGSSSSSGSSVEPSKPDLSHPATIQELNTIKKTILGSKMTGSDGSPPRRSKGSPSRYKRKSPTPTPSISHRSSSMKVKEGYNERRRERSGSRERRRERSKESRHRSRLSAAASSSQSGRDRSERKREREEERSSNRRERDGSRRERRSEQLREAPRTREEHEEWRREKGREKERGEGERWERREREGREKRRGSRSRSGRGERPYRHPSDSRHYPPPPASPPSNHHHYRDRSRYGSSERERVSPREDRVRLAHSHSHSSMRRRGWEGERDYDSPKSSRDWEAGQERSRHWERRSKHSQEKDYAALEKDKDQDWKGRGREGEKRSSAPRGGDEPPPPPPPPPLPICEPELSDISDDPDDILNRDDDMEETSVEKAEEPSLEPEQHPRSTSPPPHRLDEKIGDDEAMDSLGFEEISDEELEEESKHKVGDALGVDWGSLVAECRARKTVTELGPVCKTWDTESVLLRVGVSRQYAGDQLFNSIQNKLIASMGKGWSSGIGGIQRAIMARKRHDMLEHGLSGPAHALCARHDLNIRRQLCGLPLISLEAGSSLY